MLFFDEKNYWKWETIKSVPGALLEDGESHVETSVEDQHGDSYLFCIQPSTYTINFIFPKLFLIRDTSKKMEIEKFMNAQSNVSLWRTPMDEKILALERNKTWELVELPKKKIVGLEWFVQKYKARLVACGYIQKEGIDFNETFSSVASDFEGCIEDRKSTDMFSPWELDLFHGAQKSNLL